MKKNERIEALEKQLEEFKLYYEADKIKNEMYVNALVYLSKFKFENIKNDLLRKKTKNAFVATAYYHQEPKVFVDDESRFRNSYYEIDKIKDIIEHLENYSSDCITATYTFIVEQVAKDKELAKYENK